MKPFAKSKIPNVIVTYWKIDDVEKVEENVTYMLRLLSYYIAGDLNLSEPNKLIYLNCK